MIEPAAAVGAGPGSVAITPPTVNLLVRGNEAAYGVDPAMRRHHAVERFYFDRRVADHVEKLFVGPNIGLQRCNVEITNQNSFLRLERGEPLSNLGQEIEFVGELVVLGRVRYVATRRDVEIVQFGTAWQ